MYAPVNTCRQKVLEWLAELGAVELAEDHEVTLPQLAPSHWQQLHSTNPMLCKPKLDRSARFTACLSMWVWVGLGTRRQTIRLLPTASNA